MCEDHYLPTQFNYIEYEAASGGLSCPEAAVRSSYYNVGGIPQINFDGMWHEQVGAGGGDVDGQNYINLIDGRLTEDSPMSVSISDFSYESGSSFAEVSVEIFSDIGSPANHVIRCAIVEDYLVYGGSSYHNTCRTMPTTAAGIPLTVSAVGEVQVLNLPFTVGSGWNTDNLQIIAWVQRETDKYVIQSGNSWVVDYGGSFAATGAQQMLADGGAITFDPTRLTNVGLLSETFEISIDTSGLPDGWSGHLISDGTEYQEFSVLLDPYNSAEFSVGMDTGLVGSGRVTVNVSSQTTGDLLDSIDFIGVAGGTDILIVSDDGGAGFGFDVYGPAVTPTGKTYAVWNNAFAPTTTDDLLQYEAVIWQTGANTSAMSADDRASLDGFLAAGGNLVLSGENLLQSLYAQGGSARLWYQLKLRISYASGSAGAFDLTGQPGTVGEGLSFTLTGGDPDLISLLNNQPVEEAFQFGNGEPGGVQTTYNDYLVLTLPFGLELVPDAADRAAIIDGAFDWFGIMDPLAAGDTPLAGLQLLQNAPNPFNPMTKISFVMDQTGPARLEIFNARGQLVRVLADETIAAGQHSIVWDGKTATGQQAASGTYFYRLSTDNQQLTEKMSLVK